MKKFDKTKKFLTQLWHLEKVERPGYRFQGWLGEKDWLNTDDYNLIEIFENKELMLKQQLKWLDFRMQYNDDSIPMLWPYLGSGVFASAYGCETIWSKQEQPWTNPLLKKPENVYSLKQPKITDGLLGKVLEYIEYFQEKTKGVYPIRQTDTESPIDMAAILLGSQEFLIALYDNPKEVHMLLNMITDLIIEFVKKQQSIVKEFVPNHWPGIWMPDDFGISVSDDLMTMISPELYEEFALPYNNKLSDAFNGIFIHSCGDFKHNLDNLAKHKKLRGVDFKASEISYPAVVEKLSGKALLVVRWGLNKYIHFESCLDFLKHVLDNKKEDTSLFIFVEKGIDNKTGKYIENSFNEVCDFMYKNNIRDKD